MMEMAQGILAIRVTLRSTFWKTSGEEKRSRSGCKAQTAISGITYLQQGVEGVVGDSVDFWRALV